MIDDDQVTLRAFHRAGIYLPAESEEAELRAAVRAAVRDAAARLMPPTLLAVVLFFSSSAFFYALGRGAEAQLTLDALHRAEYATELLRRYVPQGEAALDVCRVEDGHLIREIQRTPLAARVAP